MEIKKHPTVQPVDGFFTMQDDPPELIFNGKYSNFGETCDINSSEMLWIKLHGNPHKVHKGRFERYLWAEDGDFVEPSYGWKIDDESIAISEDDEWAYMSSPFLDVEEELYE